MARWRRCQTASGSRRPAGSRLGGAVAEVGEHATGDRRGRRGLRSPAAAPPPEGCRPRGQSAKTAASAAATSRWSRTSRAAPAAGPGQVAAELDVVAPRRCPAGRPGAGSRAAVSRGSGPGVVHAVADSSSTRASRGGTPASCRAAVSSAKVTLVSPCVGHPEQQVEHGQRRHLLPHPHQHRRVGPEGDDGEGVAGQLAGQRAHGRGRGPHPLPLHRPGDVDDEDDGPALPHPLADDDVASPPGTGCPRSPRGSAPGPARPSPPLHGRLTSSPTPAAEPPVAGRPGRRPAGGRSAGPAAG